MENEKFAMEIIKELKTNSKRWFVISIILLIALIGSNVSWLIHEGQYETVAEQTTVDGGENGIATYLEDSESGDINYGKDSKN